MRAKVPYSTRLATRSGWVAANSIAIGPPSSIATTLARSEPAASITARTSSICSSSVGGLVDGSDIPLPRRSNTIRRPISARRAKKRTVVGTSHRCSSWDSQVGTYRMSSGPSPVIE